MAAIQKNILEHISLMAQEQVELEFAEQLQQIQMLQMQAQQDPQAQQALQKLSQDIEARKSVLIAEMTEEFMKEEKKITSLAMVWYWMQLPANILPTPKRQIRRVWN